MTAIGTLQSVHVAAGAVTLAALGIALLSGKGGVLHRRAGWVYVAAIGVSVATSWILGVIRLLDDDRSNDANAFVMAFLGLLTANAVFAGLRVLRVKDRVGPHTNPLDVGSSVVLGLASLAVGGYTLWHGSPVFTALAAVGAFRAIDQLRYWRRSPDAGMHWRDEHLANMMTSGIAALTAFLLNVFARSSPLLWLAPGVVGGVAIILWQRSYRRSPAV